MTVRKYKELQQKYYLGLDMGTSSLGWAITDERYHLLRAKGKDMWGVRLLMRQTLQQKEEQKELLEEDYKEKKLELVI